MFSLHFISADQISDMNSKLGSLEALVSQASERLRSIKDKKLGQDIQWVSHGATQCIINTPCQLPGDCAQLLPSVLPWHGLWGEAKEENADSEDRGPRGHWLLPPRLHASASISRIKQTHHNILWSAQSDLNVIKSIYCQIVTSYHSFLVSLFFELYVVIIEGEIVLISLNRECLHVFQSFHLIIWRPALCQSQSLQLP